MTRRFALHVIAASSLRGDVVEPHTGDVEAVVGDDGGHPHDVFGAKPHDELIGLTEEPLGRPGGPVGVERSHDL